MGGSRSCMNYSPEDYVLGDQTASGIGGSERIRKSRFFGHRDCRRLDDSATRNMADPH